MQFNKSYCEIFNQHPQFVKTYNFIPNKKDIPEAKNAPFGCFGQQF